MKLCFSTLGCTEKSLDQVIAIAAEFGIGALELRGLDGILRCGQIPALLPENATDTKNKLAAAGLVPTVLCTSCSFHDENNTEAALDEGREAIRLAAEFGFPFIRVFGNNVGGEPAVCHARVADGIRTLCREAVPYGVSILLEVHGDYNRCETICPILDALRNEPNFGLIWDVAHSHGVYGKDWMLFYRAIRPFIRHVHLKDVASWATVPLLTGKGEIPLTDILRRLREDGYDGCISLEWERKWYPMIEPIEDALSAFLATVQEAELP